MKKQLTVTIGGIIVATKSTKVEYQFCVVCLGEAYSWHKSWKAAQKALANHRAYCQDFADFVDGKESRSKYTIGARTSDSLREEAASLQIVAVD